MRRARRIGFGSALLVAVAGTLVAGGERSAAGERTSTWSAQAPDSALEARTSAVASQLRCPVCQGVSIEDSPTELARSMRATVRDQLAAGRSAEEVKAYFVGRYGEWVLLEPEPSGFNLLVYVLPALGLAAGIVIVGVAVRRWTRPTPVTPSES